MYHFCIHLNFFEDINEVEDLEDVDRNHTMTQFRVAKLALLKLKGCNEDNKDPQLIALLHGPGGSGKSMVINAVQTYAKSYCESIGHQFTNHTIIVTAMSGVAATLLK